MTSRTRIILVVIVAIALSATFFFRGSSTKPSTTHDSAGFIVGRNVIYIAEQSPSRTVSVAVARLESTGFIAIHEDSADSPGKILGVSGLLPAGETKNLTPVVLSRATADGETLYATLYLDDGDGVFDSVKDTSAFDSLGGEPVMMIFTVSMDASEPATINL